MLVLGLHRLHTLIYLSKFSDLPRQSRWPDQGEHRGRGKGRQGLLRQGDRQVIN